MTGPEIARPVALKLAEQVDALVTELLPSARRNGGYWSIGNLAGDAGSSLYIHRSGAKVGKWTDTATGEFGDLLDLINQVKGGGRDMPFAIRWAMEWLRIEPTSIASTETRPRYIPPAQTAEDEAAIGAARGLFQRAKPTTGTLAEVYFNSRGIDGPLPPSIRFMGALTHYPTNQALPVIIAAISGTDRKVTAVQRIYLRPDGRGKAEVDDSKLTLGRMLGGACRLARATSDLGLAEGVETGMSAMRMHTTPVWAACGSSMDAVAVPDDVERLVIFGDNGEPGRRAAQRAAIAHQRNGRKIEIIYPPQAFKDFNDQLQALAAGRAA
jgi:hypothetical protein